MIPNRTWSQFQNAHKSKGWTLQEMKRRYQDERKRFDQEQQFINSGLFIKGIKNG